MTGWSATAKGMKDTKTVAKVHRTEGQTQRTPCRPVGLLLGSTMGLLFVLALIFFPHKTVCFYIMN